MKQILVAHPDLEMFDTLSNLIADAAAAGKEPIVTNARNAARAVSLIESEAPHVVIVGLDLPADRRSGPVPLGGLRLAESLRARGLRLPLIFIAPFIEPELSEAIDKLGRAALVLEGQNFDDDLIRQVDCVGEGIPSATSAEEPPGLPQAPATEVPAPIDEGRLSIVPSPAPRAPATSVPSPVRYGIEIQILSGGRCMYNVHSTGGSVPYRNNIAFQVEPAELAELSAKTAGLVGSATWADDYEELGERVCRVLLKGSPEVTSDLDRIAGRMQCQPDSQQALCFVVGKDVYPIALESLRDGPRNGRRYWLESAPLWRQLAGNVTQSPLFRDAETRDGPINCLVVEANTSGRVAEWKLDFPELPGVKLEADWLSQHLREQTTTPIGKIGRIGQEGGRVWTSIQSPPYPAGPVEGAEREDHADSFEDVLEALLTKQGPWHLVHFAGHSHYRSNGKEDFGYVLLPGPIGADGTPQPHIVGTPLFASWLRQSRFVYMSSCKGSSHDFVFSLCNNQVPALTGFRWEINDNLANQHSTRFYKALFKRRSLEDALQETWLAMYGRYRGDNVWASSQLVMQLAA